MDPTCQPLTFFFFFSLSLIFFLSPTGGGRLPRSSSGPRRRPGCAAPAAASSALPCGHRRGRPGLGLGSLREGAGWPARPPPPAAAAAGPASFALRRGRPASSACRRGPPRAPWPRPPPPVDVAPASSARRLRRGRGRRRGRRPVVRPSRNPDGGNGVGLVRSILADESDPDLSRIFPPGRTQPPPTSIQTSEKGVQPIRVGPYPSTKHTDRFPEREAAACRWTTRGREGRDPCRLPLIATPSPLRS